VLNSRSPLHFVAAFAPERKLVAQVSAPTLFSARDLRLLYPKART
jgi:hypothetical protein